MPFPKDPESDPAPVPAPALSIKVGDSVTVHSGTGHPGPALVIAVHEKNIIDVRLPDGKLITQLQHQDAGNNEGWSVTPKSATTPADKGSTEPPTRTIANPQPTPGKKIR